MRDPPPPRTRPRWRPCARVITSRMTFASPWRRAPSTMPSSVQSIIQQLSRPRGPLRPRRHHTTGFVVGDEATIIVRLLLFLLRAGVDRVEIGDRLIRQ